MELLKIDLGKSDTAYYRATKSPVIVQLDNYYYLTISGKGDPEKEEFNNAIQAIYAVAYGIKFLCKAEDNDFTVPKMECLWWINGGLENQHLFISTPRDGWYWKIMIRMPDVVESDHFFRAVYNAQAKKPELPLSQIKFELEVEGKCIQILHLGPYEEEFTSIKKIFELMAQEQLSIAGYHKEIYLTDPRKTSPEKLRTILRYKVV